jgi:DNA-binding GntR family transcriptional regulator
MERNPQMLTLKQHAYQAIRQKLESGHMTAGDRLSDIALASELGISRSPVREAISQLASEGLVEYRPRCGAFIKAAKRREMEELYEVRMALEGFAAGKAAQLSNEEQVAELDRLQQELMATVRECRQRPNQVADQELTDRFLAADLRFHWQILHIAGNSKMISIVEDCKILIRAFSHVPVKHDLPLLSASVRQHAAILEAIRRHEIEAARHNMTEHIAMASALVLREYNGENEKPCRTQHNTSATGSFAAK